MKLELTDPYIPSTRYILEFNDAQMQRLARFLNEPVERSENAIHSGVFLFAIVGTVVDSDELTDQEYEAWVTQTELYVLRYPYGILAALAVGDKDTENAVIQIPTCWIEQLVADWLQKPNDAEQEDTEYEQHHA